MLERAVQIDRTLPVLVVARSLHMPCYLEAMQLGAVDYLAEPLSMKELGQTVERYMRPGPLGKAPALRTGIKRGEGPVQA